MNRLSVKINGMEYTLKGEEKEEYLLRLASYVDKKLKSIMDINPRLDTTSVAVLTAVNSIDEMFKQRQAYENVVKEKEEALRGDIVFNEEINDLRKQLDSMRLLNEELNEKLKNSKNEADFQAKDEKIKKLKNSLQRNLKELDELKEINKELKFKNQSANYKILDLQKKLMDSQIDFASTKKQNLAMKNNPLDKKKLL